MSSKQEENENRRKNMDSTNQDNSRVEYSDLSAELDQMNLSEDSANTESSQNETFSQYLSEESDEIQDSASSDKTSNRFSSSSAEKNTQIQQDVRKRGIQTANTSTHLNDSEKSNAQSDRARDDSSKPSKSDNKKFLAIPILVAIFIAFFVWFWFIHSQNFTTFNSPSTLNSKLMFHKIKSHDAFGSQSKLFRTNIVSAISKQFESSRSLAQSASILIFAPNSTTFSNGASNSQKKREFFNKADTLITELARTLKFGQSAPNHCATFNYPILLQTFIDSSNSDSVSSMDDVDANLIRQLTEIIETAAKMRQSSAASCLQIIGLEAMRLPMLRHVFGLTDGDTAPYKDVVYFFPVWIQVDAQNMRLETLNGTTTLTARRAEKNVRDALEVKWKASGMHETKTPALLSRIANNIVFVNLQ